MKDVLISLREDRFACDRSGVRVPADPVVETEAFLFVSSAGGHENHDEIKKGTWHYVDAMLRPNHHRLSAQCGTRDPLWRLFRCNAATLLSKRCLHHAQQTARQTWVPVHVWNPWIFAMSQAHARWHRRYTVFRVFISLSQSWRIQLEFQVTHSPKWQPFITFMLKGRW